MASQQRPVNVRYVDIRKWICWSKRFLQIYCFVL